MSPIDNYANEKVKQAFRNCDHLNQGICRQCVRHLIAEVAADQKRAAVAALRNTPRAAASTTEVSLIYKDEAIELVSASQPENEPIRGE